MQKGCFCCKLAKFINHTQNNLNVNNNVAKLLADNP